MRRITCGIILIILLTTMLAFVHLVPTARAVGITVPDDYATIQGAVNAAIDGDTINVRAGIYYENVIISKKVSLIGESKSTTIIDGGGDGNVLLFTATADTANISSFTLRNGRGLNDGAGIDVQGSSNHTISNNIVSSNQRGLRLQTSRYNSIFDNQFLSNIEIGIELRTSHWNSIFNNTASGNGLIWIIGSSINSVVNNELSNGGGIGITESFNNTLRGNRMSRGGFFVQGVRIQDYIHDIDFSNTIDGKAIFYLIGEKNVTIDSLTRPEVGYIGLVNCEGMTVKHLDLEANEEGILLVNTTGSLIENLHIDGSSAGICIEFGSRNNTVKGNTVSAELAGIYLYQNSSYNVIYENQVTCLNSGIRTLDFSNYNVIYHNDFFQSNPQQMTWDSTNTWDNGYPSGGNHWSDYTGTDFFTGLYQNETGSDGIGDTPYVISTENVDHYPLMIPYETPPPALVGDVNLDGTVDILDLVTILVAYYSSSTGPNWNPRCDLNVDSFIDIQDLAIAASHFGEAG